MMLRSERNRPGKCRCMTRSAPTKEGNEINLLDIIESEEIDVVEQMSLNSNIQKLYRNMDSPSLQAGNGKSSACAMAWGLPSRLPEKEIARQLGISRSYVSRIEKKALEKLRNQCGW